MKLVKATSMSRVKNLRIKDLGRIANEGEIFVVSDDRYKILAGNNSYHCAFVEFIKDLPEDSKPSEEPKEVEVPNIPPTADKGIEATEEEPEIFLIEPNKEPVRVDENLEPIKEEKPKKSRKKKKEVVEE